MIDGIPVWASDLSGWGAFVMVVLGLFWAVMSGRLVPRRHLDDANARADKFQHAWELLFKARQEEERPRSEVALEVGNITAKVMEELQARAAAKDAAPTNPKGDS